MIHENWIGLMMNRTTLRNTTAYLRLAVGIAVCACGVAVLTVGIDQIVDDILPSTMIALLISLVVIATVKPHAR
jgi:hypothetical protein